MKERDKYNLSFILLGISILVFLIGFSGCYTPPSYEVYGLQVFDDDRPVPKSETKLVLDKSIELWKEVKDRNTRKVFSDGSMRLYYKDNVIHCGKDVSEDTGLCYGITNSYSMEVYVPEDRYCLMYAILLHELGHAISKRVFGTIDRYHIDKEIYGEDGIVETGYYELVYNNPKCMETNHEALHLLNNHNIITDE